MRYQRVSGDQLLNRSIKIGVQNGGSIFCENVSHGESYRSLAPYSPPAVLARLPSRKLRAIVLEKAIEKQDGGGRRKGLARLKRLSFVPGGLALRPTDAHESLPRWI